MLSRLAGATPAQHIMNYDDEIHYCPECGWSMEHVLWPGNNGLIVKLCCSHCGLTEVKPYRQVETKLVQVKKKLNGDKPFSRYYK